MFIPSNVHTSECKKNLTNAALPDDWRRVYAPPKLAATNHRSNGQETSMATRRKSNGNGKRGSGNAQRRVDAIALRAARDRKQAGMR